jgi:hypothetical protein
VWCTAVCTLLGPCGAGTFSVRFFIYKENNLLSLLLLNEMGQSYKTEGKKIWKTNFEFLTIFKKASTVSTSLTL